MCAHPFTSLSSRRPGVVSGSGLRGLGFRVSGLHVQGLELRGIGSGTFGV